MRSGSRLLIVTLSATASREIDLHAAVSAVLAAVDKPIRGCGDFTIAEVMLTMRPNLRARMPGSRARISRIGAIMLLSNAAIQASRSQSCNLPGGGPALLFTRISASGQAASRVERPSALVMSATTQRTVAVAVAAMMPARALQF